MYRTLDTLPAVHRHMAVLDRKVKAVSKGLGCRRACTAWTTSDPMIGYPMDTADTATTHLRAGLPCPFGGSRGSPAFPLL